MKEPSNIPHPLRDRTGTSQRTRVIDALNSDNAPIDGKTLADRLYMISKYARQINYYEYVRSDTNGEYQDIDNWNVFFKKSLPFQLAILSKTSINAIENEYTVLLQELQSNPSKQGLESLLIFIDTTFVLPVTALFNATDKAGNSFADSLMAIIKSSFIQPLKTFVAIYNASATFLCISKKNFNEFLMPPWQLGVEDVYGYDVCIQQSKKGKKEGYLIAARSINSIFYQFISGFQDIIETAPGFIEEALNPLQESLKKRHQPHLGLLFTFLELFKNLQASSNDLTQKHLDFFYQRVLQISPGEAIPDKAHVIFQIAKHLDEYLLKENLLLKNGKDANKEDIQFGLDHEIIIDKAQITDLRTLSVPKTADDQYIEGVYIAPVANSVDGQGGKFKKDQSMNWATLGARYSKQIKDGNLIEDEHPKARLGFVISSPVLLLQEGKRTITVRLDCELPDNSGFSQSEIDSIVDGLNVEKETLTFCINDQFIEECESLSLAAKEYLTKLLIQENPYTIRDHNLDTFLSVLDPISCEPIFDESDKTKFKECLQLFYSINNQISEIPELSSAAITYIGSLLEKQDEYVIETSQLKSFLESDSFTKSDKLKIINFLNASQATKKIDKDTLFTIRFSGEKEWLIPDPENLATLVSASEGIIKFDIRIELDTDFPSIVFYNEEKLKEKIDLQDNFPIVKIELNPDTSVLLTSDGKDVHPCKLRRDINSIYPVDITPYHFLKGLKLIDAQIDVEVCGVKNLIVQNDDNLQDVNKPIQPFGPRPKVGENWNINNGANFYIGSKEIFCKNWKNFWINTTWKDKPENLYEYYRFYRTNEFEDGSRAISNISFRFLTSILDDGIWKKDEVHNDKGSDPVEIDGIPVEEDDEFSIIYDKDYCHEYSDGTELFPLFKNSLGTDINPCNPADAVNIADCNNESDSNPTYQHGLQSGDFEGYSYQAKTMPEQVLEPLTVNTRKGFIRLTLAGTSFQHHLYTYVLTRQMMALAGLIDPESIAVVQDDLKKSKTLTKRAGQIITAILQGLSGPGGVEECLDNIVNTSIDGLVAEIQQIVLDVNAAIGKFEGSVAKINAALEDSDADATNDMKSILSRFTTIINTDIDTIATNLNSNLIAEVNAVKTQIQTDVIPLSTTLQTDLGTIQADVSDPGVPALLSASLTNVENLMKNLEDDPNPPSNDSTFIRLDNLLTNINTAVSLDLGTLQTDLNVIKSDIEGVNSRIDTETDELTGFIAEIVAINVRIAALETGGIQDIVDTEIDAIRGKIDAIKVLIEENNGLDSIPDDAFVIDGSGDDTVSDQYGAEIIIKDLCTRIERVISALNVEGRLGLPQEPYTPIIKNLSIDYTAIAEKDDMDIIHLYPFENTSKLEDIQQNPTLFPFLDDEGTLFIGIENLTPGGNLSILFQLAEATADSEMPRATIKWHYLSNNNWIELVPDFNIISDETNGLTVSGIVTIAVPDSISKIGNTVMPDHLYWIKVSTTTNAKAVAETIGIHTQAAKASARLSEGNDRKRLSEALEAGSISKLSEGDFSVKKVEHLYPSFDGKQPEAEGHFYVRVSEHLKHKGRALMLNDYEKIVLEGFPEIYKVKCISHTMGLSALTYKNDLEVAPGYVVITVIPDLTKLVSGNQLEPKVPVSLLEKIAGHLRKKISAFARIKVMNPRYEYVNVDITVRLHRGKSSSFYQKQLKQDISNLLSPWFLGDSEKIAFGMPVLFSDVVGFVEQLDYVDFIIDLKLSSDDDQYKTEIKPLTARSILTAGKICVLINEEKCVDNPTNVPIEQVRSH